MAKQLIECVPNFSEGRRQDVIESIVKPFKEQKGCYLFDYRADEDHNRLVVSLAGEPQAISDAVMAASKVAVDNIDLNTHKGAHPRMGAIDVIPFTPISGISMDECVELARSFGKRFHEELNVPVYYYEDAAIRPDRTRLEVIRKGQYEGLKEEITKPERHPDLGEPKLHPTAGATVIGARKFLVAFNVNLNTTDVEIAKTIGKRVRASGGGFTAVKGIGLALEDKGMVQVSMNIVDYDKTAIYRALEFIRMEAARWGVTVNGTEVYGMIPVAAMLDSAAYYMQIDDFDPNQVLELKLLELMREEN
ncbi:MULTISPECIES: glutamate formimidoyltransferase [Dethiosulfovibrio]|uniref:glutamate formimidoyltransferase n=2 Tax=Dethiosulfovibrio TaxID=47054 RepID=A0ABS9EQ51_9BACT|nr:MULTISPECIES: glutamate formimidoyltransferase [Dethiosulfovibrio]MEA3285102.1 glutamate formimidoyltransferase [Synergistota bacterium]MCF4114332.1 glutamate formimidoyltransferase [Dethiosulfovibrio russensis]MCF4143324.1 glutamate formimidoyltransferase [Dethiosulfovibrio marinus]MCF4145493.1 glutamate formimidoyltransferase [Dethiosulfovibrio acidaminovorans]MCF4152069.1 glutamate formimidoyltransferase [Dethiosulfovibrio faecalis]